MAEQAQLPDPEKNGPLGAIPKKYSRLIVASFVVTVSAVLFFGSSSSQPKPTQNQQQFTQKAAPPSPQQIAQLKLAMEQQQTAIEQARKQQEEMAAITAAIQHGGSPEMQGVKARNAAMVNAQTAAISDQQRGYRGSYGGGYAYAQPQQARAEEKHEPSGSIVFDLRDKEKQDQPRQEETKAEQVAAKKPGLLDPDPSLPTYVLPEGTVIEAVLTNKLVSANTGPANCQVSTPVYAPGTRKVVIPQGAKFMGSTSSVTALGQDRMAVTFHRVLIGSGAHMYAISLQAPGMDQQGATALKDKVDNHWASTLGVSLAIGGIAGLSQIGNDGYSIGSYDPSVAIRNGITSNVSQQSLHILDRLLNRPPTVEIGPGTRVKILLTSDVVVPEYQEEKSL